MAFGGGSRYHVKSRIIIDAKSHIRENRSRLGLDIIRTVLRLRRANERKTVGLFGGE